MLDLVLNAGTFAAVYEFLRAHAWWKCQLCAWCSLVLSLEH